MRRARLSITAAGRGDDWGEPGGCRCLAKLFSRRQAPKPLDENNNTLCALPHVDAVHNSTRAALADLRRRRGADRIRCRFEVVDARVLGEVADGRCSGPIRHAHLR